MPNNGLQQDSLFTLLQAELAKERDAGNTLSPRFVKLATLLALHAEDKKGGFEAWKATLIAWRLGIPSPIWAIDLLEKAECPAIRGFDEHGKETIIETLLGFKGRGKGGGKNSPVQRSLQAKQCEELCWSVRVLVSTGRSLESACRIVTRKFETIPKEEICYPLRRPKAASLVKAYRKWEKERGKEVLSFYDQGLASIPCEIREKLCDKFMS